MNRINELSDDEIDKLLLLLFNDAEADVSSMPESIRKLSDANLLRMRSRNHPDKWPHVDKAAYQAAVQELDRRRKAKSES